MLTIEPATDRRDSGRGRIGLALAGGGPLGAFYELGALHALGECTDGLDLTQLHGYVGVSSGAIIAAALANGISTNDMGWIFVGDDTQNFPMAPGIVMWPAFGEYLQRVVTVPSLMAQVLGKLARGTVHRNWANALSPLMRALPVGVFDNSPFEKYLRDMLSKPGRTNDFRKLKHPLRIIAADLNSSSEVRFGDPGFDRVPISRAIQASTALPGLYTPVCINNRTLVDGALLRTMHASVVLDQGAQLVISVNPLVPFAGGQRGRSNLTDEGLSAVMSQTFRALIQSRMQVGMARYGERYPYSDRLLLEPDRDDEAMFFVNVFSYAGRQRLVNHAYQRTRRDLLEQSKQLGPILARHGITLQVERLRDARRTFRKSIGESGDSTHPTTKKLTRALKELSAWLHHAA
jgi:NTE family protein